MLFRSNNSNVNFRGGDCDNRIRGRSMDSREGYSSYGEGGGGGGESGSGLGSYAMMGVEMSAPCQQQQQQQ